MIITSIISGILIGVAVVIPGLSASVFMVVTGIYDDIIFSISNLKKDFKKEFIYLLPIGIGGVIGILISTKLILWLCEEYPLHSYSFFIGLVIGSLPFVFKKIKDKKITLPNIILAIVGFLFILLLSKLESSGGNSESYIAINTLTNGKDIGIMFFAGILSCSLMSIPGVSGSVLLMIIGQYGSVYNSVAKITDSVVDVLKGNFVEAMVNSQSVFVIIPFAIGALAGVFLIAKALAIIIERYSSYLYSMVVGIIIAAVLVLFNMGILEKTKYFSKGLGAIPNIVFCIILLLLGYIASTKFENKED